VNPPPAAHRREPLPGRVRRSPGSGVLIPAIVAGFLVAGTAAARDDAGSAQPIGRLDEIARVVGACWSPPRGLIRFESVEITVRFSLTRSGELIGVPRMTFTNIDLDRIARDRLSAAAEAAIRRCTPVRMTATLAAAVAGRPLTVRLVYRGTRGQGV